MDTYNGMPGGALPPVAWRQSSANGPRDGSVEMARLSGGDFAVRNSRHPDGPALIYTRAEVAALIEGVKAGEFDDLLGEQAELQSVG